MAEPPAKKEKKAGEKDFSLGFDFSSTDALDPALLWKNPPASFTLENGIGLRIIPKPHTDFWRKTFHDKPADRATGHALLYTIPNGVKKCVAETTFTLECKSQYDQAGIMVFIDDHHWLKAGIEVEEGVANMSCVVTNGQSDWNYRVWPRTNDVRIRVQIELYSGFCECKVEHVDLNEKAGGVIAGKWCFLREAPICLPCGWESEGVKVGIMCCAPKKESDGEGMEAIFNSLAIQGE